MPGTQRTRRRRVQLPWPALVLAATAVVFFALPLLGLVWRAPWSNAWRYLSDDAALTGRLRLQGPGEAGLDHL